MQARGSTNLPAENTLTVYRRHHYEIGSALVATQTEAAPKHQYAEHGAADHGAKHSPPGDSQNFQFPTFCYQQLVSEGYSESSKRSAFIYDARFVDFMSFSEICLFLSYFSSIFWNSFQKF